MCQITSPQQAERLVTADKPHGIKSARTGDRRGCSATRNPPTPPVLNRPPLQPSIPPGAHAALPIRQSYWGQRQAHGNPVPAPPSIATRGPAGDRIYVRSFRDGENHSQHSRNSRSPLCRNCHLLGPKSNSAVRSKLNLLSPKFGFL